MIHHSLPPGNLSFVSRQRDAPGVRAFHIDLRLKATGHQIDKEGARVELDPSVRPSLVSTRVRGVASRAVRLDFRSW